MILYLPNYYVAAITTYPWKISKSILVNVNGCFHQFGWIKHDLAFFNDLRQWKVTLIHKHCGNSGHDQCCYQFGFLTICWHPCRSSRQKNRYGYQPDNKWAHLFIHEPGKFIPCLRIPNVFNRSIQPPLSGRCRCHAR
jgi:hypothetical protein